MQPILSNRRDLHTEDTRLAMTLIINTLSLHGPCTRAELRIGIQQYKERQGIPEADAWNSADKIIGRGITNLKRPIVSCIGLSFPYIVATKDAQGEAVYVCFADLTINTIQSHIDQVIRPHKTDVIKSEQKKQAEYEQLCKAMKSHRVRTAGLLDYQCDLYSNIDD